MTVDIGHRAIIERTLDGGGTFDALTLQPIEPAEGYAVAITGVTRDASTFPAVCIPGLARHIAYENGAAIVGTWLEGGTLYVDVVRVIRDRDEAMRLGREHGQIAIYDFAAGKEIVL